MDFQSNKMNQPFNPTPNYFQGLSNNIQNRIGIEVKNVFEIKAPKIDFSKKQKPIQLTVEFGFPLSAEKNNTDAKVEPTENQTPTNLVKDDEIGQIHIEPIQITPNANPYWHNFNSDDELEGLVLDSEGQEMSDITINGDETFDLDKHFFKKEKNTVSEIEVSPIVNEVEATAVVDQIEVLPIVNEVEATAIVDQIEVSPIVNEVEASAIVDQIEVSPIVNEVEVTAIVDQIEVSPIINEVEATAIVDQIEVSPIINEVEVTAIVDQIEVSPIINEVEATAIVDQIEVSPIVNEVEATAIVDQIEVSPIVNEVEATAVVDQIEVLPIVNEVEATAIVDQIEVSPIVNEIEIPSFSFSFVPEVELPAIENTVEVDSIANTIEEIQTIQTVSESVIEYSFSDAELDSLHDEMSLKNNNTAELEIKKEEKPSEIIFVEFATNDVVIDPEREYSDAELDMLHEQLSKDIESSKPRVAEKTSKTKSDSYVNSSSVEPIIEVKSSWTELIPWSSVFGIVASLMAVASAWFIWNSIQKPIAIDEFIDSKIAPVITSTNSLNKDLNADQSLKLPAADFIANEIIDEVENSEEFESAQDFQFSNLSDQSKISAVVLESNGLTTLDLEDGFFSEVGI